MPYKTSDFKVKLKATYIHPIGLASQLTQDFYNGVTFASGDDAEHYGLIDKSGNWITDQEFIDAYDFKPDGFAREVVHLDRSESGVPVLGWVDTTGKFYLKKPEK